MRYFLLITAIILLCICIYLQLSSMHTIRLVNTKLDILTAALEDIYPLEVEYYEN